MSRLFYHVMQDNSGNLLFNVSGTMRLAGTGTLATIYGDEALTVILPNPMTNHTSFGSFKCYLPAGDFDFYMAKAGYTFETLTGLQGLGSMANQDANTVVITGGSLVGLAQLGVASAPSAGQVFAVNGRSYLFGETGIGVTPDPAYWLRVAPSGNALIVNKSDEVGIRANPTAGVAFAVNGTSYLGETGLGITPDAAYWLRVSPSGNALLVNKSNEVGIQAAPTAGMALSVAGRSYLLGETGIGITPDPAYWLRVSPGGNALMVNKSNEVGINSAPTAGVALSVNGASYLFGATGFGGAPLANARMRLSYVKASMHGAVVQPSDTDTGGSYAIVFNNVGGTFVGGIFTDATTTAYATTSDARLKHAIETLGGALDVVTALRPVRFRWNQDDSQGHGFLAHELQATIPEAVSGEPDEVHEDGSIRPQGVDHSKLVPWLTAALQEMLAQVQALTARVSSLEEALGI